MVRGDTCKSSGTFAVTNQTSYYVYVGTSSETAINANFTCTPVTRPSNDKCEGASAVVDGPQYEFDVTGASTDFASTLGCNGFGYNEIFLKYTANCTGLTTLYAEKVNGSGSDFYLVGYINQACSVLPPVICFDLGNTVSFPTDAGMDYYMSLGTYSSGTFDGSVLVNFTCSTLPPSTPRPTRAPTTPKPTTPKPTMKPTTSAPNTKAPTTGTPTTGTPTTGKPTTKLSGAGAIQVGLASLLGFLIVA
jgi:hypothetical protein